MGSQLDTVDHALARPAVACKAKRLARQPERAGVVSAKGRNVSCRSEDQCKLPAFARLRVSVGGLLKQSLRVSVLPPPCCQHPKHPPRQGDDLEESRPGTNL